MSNIVDIIQNSKINKLNNKTLILQEISGNIGTPNISSIKNQYLYENDWISNTPQNLSSNFEKWLLSGNGSFLIGLEDFDSSSIRGISRHICNINNSFTSYHSIYQTPFEASTGIVFSLEVKLAVKSNSLSAGASNRIIFGFVDNGITPNMLKNVTFKIDCNNTTRTLSTSIRNEFITGGVSLGTVGNEEFNLYKIEVNKLNTINFYKNNILVDSYNQVGVTFDYIPNFSTSELVKIINENSAFVYMDYTIVKADYDEGVR